MNNRARLYSVALKYADDIAVADYLLHKMGGDHVATPGQLVNWVIRMDPEDMDDKKAKLKGLYDKYNQGIAVDEYTGPLGYLTRHWEGDGARAFVQRFGTLRKYVIGEEAVGGVMTYLELQINDMRTLAENTRKFQGEVADLVEQYLRGLRKKYINALTANGGGSDTEIIGTAADYGAVGVGLGAFGGPPSSAVGGAVGMLIGAVRGFLESTEKSARNHLHIGKVGKSFAMTIKELSTKLDVMDRDRYSNDEDLPGDAGYGRSRYGHADHETGDPQKDPSLDKPWT